MSALIPQQARSSYMMGNVNKMQINKESECEIIKKKIKKNPKDWAEHFNNKGEKMISAPDIYKAENKELIESLKEDFEESWEVTSTRIIYNKDNLNAEIIHDADSNVVKPKSLEKTRNLDFGHQTKAQEKTNKFALSGLTSTISAGSMSMATGLTTSVAYLVR